ncbi:MAG: hypothetical protein F6K50_50370 [Moorea sp. SIO3I7]|uniref:hypothetical protein n=1 Tax=unclassified Moorena TaxID=2683338 RepID=UPI0013C7DD39|nr:MULTISPECIES: hypothetical protein [unclassified Moorena]NEO03234.1 hypothetical protein [Moorena sp. SIO3I7]NEO13737.1 hypothetical protein [Moorena sp. SIO3E8]NEO50675.1 hypothetical protein [Moorena sp. SIO4A3]NEQ02002.1 hypothetical protein [Moorena sp. SIO3F7]
MFSKYPGVQQHWFVVESQKRKESDLKQLQKKLSHCNTQLANQTTEIERAKVYL